MKIVFLSLVLLLVITKGLASGAAITRKMMVAEDKPYSAAREQHNNEKGEAVAKSSAMESKLDINNHHSIPRQSWDSSQNNGPDNDNQSNGGGSVDMIHS